VSSEAFFGVFGQTNSNLADGLMHIHGKSGSRGNTVKFSLEIGNEGVRMAKKGYFAAIEKKTLKNSDFRRVLYTGKYSQLVLMSLLPGEEIGAEVHKTHDQFFRVEAGNGIVAINNAKYKIGNGDCVIVPSGAMHNVTNTGKAALKIYTLYSPPAHKDGVARKTKKLAEASEEHFDGRTTE
jgi:mannose-6-phosphate isomerase-like protein (cupin superfamily)